MSILTLDEADGSRGITPDELEEWITEKSRQTPFSIKRNPEWFLYIEPIGKSAFILTEKRYGEQRVIMDFADAQMIVKAASLIAQDKSLDELEDGDKQWSEYRGKEKMAIVQWSVIVTIFAVVAYGVFSVFYSLLFT